MLIPACLGLAGLFVLAQYRGRLVLAVALKGLASLCFVLLGMLCARGTAGALPFVGGLALGCLADIILGLRTLFKSRRGAFFLAGSAVFFIGHLLYLRGLWPMLAHPALYVGLSVIPCVLLLRALFSVVKADRALKGFGALYFGVFTLLNTAALCHAAAAADAFRLLFAGGALLFLASDVILNLYTFGPKLAYRFRVLYSGLYYAGQLLIALSLAHL